VEINKNYFSEDNYHSEVYKKNKIIIGNTLTNKMSHIGLWKNKLNGTFKGIAPYVISMDGKIHQYYDPKYYSEILKMGDNDKEIISILLENVGWLTKDYQKNELLTWCGNIYKKEDGPIANIKWRGKMRWAPYTQDQLDSLVQLTEYLISEFGINRYVSEHNTKILDIEEKEGIYYRSNYNINYMDVSPAFNFKEYKTKIENNGKLE